MQTTTRQTGSTGSWRRTLVLISLIWVLAGCEQSTEAPSLPESIEAVATDAPALNVDVFYATNRQSQPAEDAEDAYTGARGDLQYGRCGVEFTPIQLLGEVAPKVPFYIPSEKKKLVIAEQQSAPAFWTSLVQAISETDTQSVAIFVHGYNYGFARACRMAAEMQRVLAGKATVLMFSWPSNGLPTDYVADLTDVEWSVPRLVSLLAALHERIGPDRIQLLAHSLGSRGTIFALQRMASALDVRPMVERLVFLAPDFDAQTFTELLPQLRPLAGDITLYASSNDAPLRISEELNGHPRLGQAGPHLTVLEGLETIDVSPAGRYQVFGHEYFYFHPKVAADLITLISTGAGAAERAGLRAQNRNGVPYWEVAAD